MRVSKTIETPDGTIQFEGELSQEELDLILSVGINFLMEQGAIPFKVMSEKKKADFGEGSKELQ